ncbi:sigma 54-interacting transcriptional regulator [Cytobacillus sp. FSL W8-0315]|uniref:sigma-54 interaction domain-containing protein n=1 Tax=Cytobacillus TaxID=2675230 RepID=UPI00203CCC48|nr:sigma 54-interacting transcriptional regulator [Cytobacillus oceanisediminis]MBY0159334.1 sigma 54-interacting transcriptional regulator [Cytobacillus firmus]MCM3391591.1 sigma 54-interacting transcriptional regulator [Cytobacillus oceanisediminis]
MENNQLETYKQAFEDLNFILDTTHSAITITNGEGVFTRISKSCEKIFGVPESELVGKNAFILEEQGFFSISVTCEVIRKKRRVTIIQKTAANKTVLVTGTPIFNREKKIEKIINISKDITETDKLASDLKRLQAEHEWMKQELMKRTQLERGKVASESPDMKKIIELVHHIANMEATVLLLGETGVGKGYMADMIHSVSNRKDRPFISINCGAIPENLLESELFGYEKGAFTGALKDGKKGLFETAGSGTIFLDEIGDMPVSLQVKLLHVLDDRTVRRIGGTASFKVDCRIIAATNKDIKELVRAGQFREDLFYRLNVVPITIPSLRERKEDLLFLAKMFLDSMNNKYKMKKTFSEEAIRALYDYNYPGNIRELQNMIERLVINTIGDTIEAEKILEMTEASSPNTQSEEFTPLKEAVDQLERNMLLTAFQKYKTTRRVAEALKIDQSTVVKKAKKLKVHER